MKLFLLRWIVGFTSLIVLTLPFPYSVLPSFGNFLQPYLQPLLQMLGHDVFQLRPPFTSSILSDSTGMYLLTFGCLVAAGVVAIGWTLLAPLHHQTETLWYWFHTAVCYYLTLQLFKYGFDKLFKHQFYLPEPNTLYTPLGYLSPDIAFWSVLGTSRGYSLFAGLLEIIPGLLLLFRRTRLPGALVALVALGNVVALNFAFDVSVKLYATFLLLLSLVAAWPALSALYLVLILEQWQSVRPQLLTALTGRATRFGPLIKALVVICLLAETLLPFLQTGNFNDDLATRPSLHGAYSVQLQIQNDDTLRPTANQHQRLKRIFIHRQGYFITQTEDEYLQDYLLTYTHGHHLLSLRASNGHSSRLKCTWSAGRRRLILSGTLDYDSVYIVARALAWQQLPLLQPGFHWTTDSY